jgi:hypothetical protein
MARYTICYYGHPMPGKSRRIAIGIQHEACNLWVQPLGDMAEQSARTKLQIAFVTATHTRGQTTCEDHTQWLFHRLAVLMM